MASRPRELVVLAALNAKSEPGPQSDEDDPWKDNEWQGSCESCASFEVQHLVYDWPEWEVRSQAPLWVEFEAGWSIVNRRCQDCGHEWTQY